ncbi:tripartite tricarboxylate transporter TctB family protein [Aestuariibius sp. 2305UL40-4]|uniref:tripartite tricarboxylate transporter TctB family protein n=1 Tax=Aestuariibius violaceus TaxID=3234132 RepID=UPI00345E1958
MRAPVWGVGAVVLSLGLAAALSALAIPLGPDGDWGARLFPLLAAAALILAGLSEFRSDQRGMPSEGGDSRKVITLAALGVLYIWLIFQVGYLLASPPVIAATLYLFGVRKRTTLIVAAIIVPLALHLFFFRLLGAFPPLGDRFDILDHLTFL